MITLELPEPPSPNDAPRHPMARTRWKNKTKARTWEAAIAQASPVKFPARNVVISSHFRLYNLRDEDNLKASLKYVLDALRLPSNREIEKGQLGFKGGLFLSRGFFLDDNPRECRIEEPTQEIDRKNRGLTLTIGLRG